MVIVVIGATLFYLISINYIITHLLRLDPNGGNYMQKIPFTKSEIHEVNYLLSNDIPVKIKRGPSHKCYQLGFYILEELSIGHQYPHITFNLSKNPNGYRLTDCSYAYQTFKSLLKRPIIQTYQKRLGISQQAQHHFYYIQMPLLNSIEAYTHRMLEFLTQIKTIADLNRRQLLK